MIAARAALALGLLCGLAPWARAAPDAGSDAAPDAGSDAAIDAGVDAAAERSGDAGTLDAGRLAAALAVPVVALHGSVLEKGTRNPIAGAAITVDGAVVGQTDGDGHFDLNVPAGDHAVAVQLGGKEVVASQLRLTPGRPADDQIFRILLPGTGVRYQTTVRAARAEMHAVALSADEARQAPGTGGDPMRVIGLLPGVQQVAWPAALYVIRGANPGNTGFFLDGIRVPELFHLALPRSVIHPYLIEGVDFYPGGGPANYGPYVSGIMAARTAPPPADRVHASADVTFYEAGGIATSPWDGGRGTVAVAARYSYTGALLSALSLDTVLRYGDYQVRVDHPLAGGEATLFAFGALDDVGWTNAASANASKEYGALQFHRVDLRWRRSVGGGRLLAAATLGVDWANSTLYESPIKMRALSAAPRLVYRHALGSRMDLELGASSEAQSFMSDVPMFTSKSSDLSRSRDALSQAAYATLITRLGSRWVVSPALRADVFWEEGARQSFLEPRLDVSFQVSEGLVLKANGGRFAQMPSLPVSVAGFEAFSLADLGAQTSTGGSAGVQTRLPWRFSLNVTGYYQKLQLTDVRNIDFSMPMPMAADFLVSRQGRAYGVEVLLRRADAGRLFGWVAYTLSWSQRYDDNGVLGRSDWDERHILNLVSGYRIGRATTVGLGFHLNTGRWAPVINSPDGQYRSIPTYYQIDVRAERRFVFDRFVMDLYADIENVTDNAEVVQYLSNASPRYPEAYIEQKLQFPLPTIGVHAQF